MSDSFYAAHDQGFELVFGHPIAIGRMGGEFTVLSGKVWLTRQGDLKDHMLVRGQSVRLASGDAALVERLYRDRSSQVAWQPDLDMVAKAVDSLRSAGLQAAGAFAWRAARVTARLTRGFDAVARRATLAHCRD